MNNEELTQRLEEEKALVEELSGDKTKLRGQLEAAHRKNRDLVERHDKLHRKHTMLVTALSPETDAAVAEYKKLTSEMLQKRKLGQSTLEDEGELAERLDGIWRMLSTEEQEALSKSRVDDSLSKDPEQEALSPKVSESDVVVDYKKAVSSGASRRRLDDLWLRLSTTEQEALSKSRVDD